MKYSRTRAVKRIERGTAKSAGIDFFIPSDLTLEQLNVKNPNFRNEFQFGLDNNHNLSYFYLEPNQRVCIPSGIHANVPEGYMLIAENKSGMGAGHGIDRLACLVDEDYQGEIHISIVNTGRKVTKLKAGQKVIQFVLVPVSYSMPEEVPFAELYTEESERGSGAFGSTGG